MSKHAEMIKDAREQMAALKEHGGDFDEWEQLADLTGPLADALEATEAPTTPVAGGSEREALIMANNTIARLTQELADKKPRVVTTVVEVEALAPGSLIYDDMDRPAGGFHLFRMVNDFISMGGIRFPVESIKLPVTVLHTPPVPA